MSKFTRKKKNLLACIVIICTTILSVTITIALAINAGNRVSSAGSGFQLDWLDTLCSLLSGAASVILGVVAVVQTEKSNKLTEELAEIDRFQFENSIMSQDCPLFRFAKNQRIDLATKTFELHFFDTKNIPTKSVYFSNIYLYPYLRDDKADAEVQPLPVQTNPHSLKAKHTVYRRKKYGLDGFYQVNIKTDPAIFQQYQHYLLEFDLSVVNTVGVVNVYKYKLLMKTPKKPAKKRIKQPTKKINLASRSLHSKLHPKVLHQFYEIETTLGEDKFKAGIN